MADFMKPPNQQMYLNTFLTYANGDRYEGAVAQSLTGIPVAHGHGTLKKLNGDYYVGQFYQGVQHGHGTSYTASTNRLYVGQFVNGQEQGWGTITRTQNWCQLKYVGFVHNTIRHGQGTHTETDPYSRDTVIWEGTWNSDVLQGPGKVTRRHPTTGEMVRYKGNFVNGMLRGWVSCRSLTTGAIWNESY